MAHGKEVSVAPKERVNIRYRSAADGVEEDVELPLRILLLGDFLNREDPRPIEERKPIALHKENFDEVMAEQDLRADVVVPNHLTAGVEGEPEDEMVASLRFRGINDFRPEGIVEQVRELRDLRELRNALRYLKGPLGNVPGFIRQIQSILKDPDKRTRLVRELGIEEGAV